MTLVSLLLTLAIALGLAATPPFKAADPPPDHATRRISTIDGLRGYLALAVVAHHDTMLAATLRTGRWEFFGRLSTMLGQGGVSMFFMVTGYLFWRHLVTARGCIHWRRLYINRVFRIGPLYLVAAVVALAAVLPGATRFEAWPTVVAETLRWLALGIFGAVNVSGTQPWFLMLGVVWSLSWEWGFYASLPVLSLFSRWRWSHLATAAAITALAGLLLLLPSFAEGYKNYYAYTTLFGIGMLTASLQVVGAVPRLSDRSSSCVAVVLLAIGFGAFSWGYAFRPVVVLGLAFYLIATGSSLFGLLRLRVSHRLGHISYGLYLLQGLVITPLFYWAAPAVITSRLAEFAVTGAVALLLVPLALLAHRWVELPGIRLGDAVAAWVGKGSQNIGLSATSRGG